MSRQDPIHYGPWEVTVTDGDTAMHYEIYAATEFEACEEVMQYSDYRSEDSLADIERDVRVTARRVT